MTADAAGPPPGLQSSAVFGFDVGTSSSKAVLVALDGRVLRSAVRRHDVDRPRPGMVEMDPDVWWDEFSSLSRELLADGDVTVVAVGCSGMGPCVLLTDESDTPVRPAILYGVDTRAWRQIERLNAKYGSSTILERCGSVLSSQAAGPKVAWVSDEEPDLFARARNLYMSSSWVVRRLTGAYVLDHHSASQCTPFYDTHALDWYRPWTEDIAPALKLPSLQWPGDKAGTVTAEAAEATCLPVGIPVVTGTIDAWSEALSVGSHGVGDLMLMYGTTMFLIHTLPGPLTSPTLWGTVGAAPGTRNLAGGMATSGAITAWLRELFGSPSYSQLLDLAVASGIGANGLLMLPYFAGERTPIMDPDARGVVAGLTLSHGRGDLYRAALEATGFAVRHNIDAIESAGGDIRRIVAVGGGTQGGVWTQIVSDITGREQEIRKQSIGASYGAALLAAQLVGDASIETWNPVEHVVVPRREAAARYDELYDLYCELYTSSVHVVHRLAQLQQR